MSILIAASQLIPELFRLVDSYCDMGEVVRLWFGPHPLVILSSPRAFEVSWRHAQMASVCMHCIAILSYRAFSFFLSFSYVLNMCVCVCMCNNNSNNDNNDNDDDNNNNNYNNNNNNIYNNYKILIRMLFIVTKVINSTCSVSYISMWKVCVF